MGGFLITRSRKTKSIQLKYLIAIGAGFMLAAVVLEIIPQVVEQWQQQTSVAMLWMLAGYLLIQLVEHTLTPHFHFGEEVHSEEVKQHGAALTAVGALAIHTFFDGVTIASGLLIDLRLGLLLFIAVLLHKVPEGFTVASIMLSAGRTSRSALKATVVIAVSTLAGIFSVALIQQAIVFALPISAGVTLYVATSDLIPEVNREGRGRASIFVFIGVALFYLTHVLLEAALAPS
ncbi:MAG TPA: ZIP family metal transporter [Blastocatellia bacterium]|nr:ZIP family metal transporter [Blastocatellia bacterium]